MSDPQERIESDLKTAMKAGEKERVGTLRMLLAEIKNERIRRGAAIDEEAFTGLLRKGVKQRHEASEQFRAGGREESAAKEEREAAMLEDYLPDQAGEAEVRAAVERFVADNEPLRAARHGARDGRDDAALRRPGRRRHDQPHRPRRFELVKRS